MVSVLALNKLELRDMITAEMVENPVLEELEESVPLLDDVDRRQEERDRAPVEESPTTAADAEKKDPFEEIDFGSFFQDYLDPGYRSSREMEDIERPSFENFLSKPGNLTDHLRWQLGSISMRPEVEEAIELVIGNLNEDGYLIASDEELIGVAPPAAPESDAALAENLFKEAAALGLSATDEPADSASGLSPSELDYREAASLDSIPADPEFGLPEIDFSDSQGEMRSAAVEQPLETNKEVAVAAQPAPASTAPAPHPTFPTNFSLADLHEAIEVVRQLDPPGVACRDLRECLLYQLRYHQQQLELHKNGNGESTQRNL